MLKVFPKIRIGRKGNIASKHEMHTRSRIIIKENYNGGEYKC